MDFYSDVVSGKVTLGMEGASVDVDDLRAAENAGGDENGQTPDENTTTTEVQTDGEGNEVVKTSDELQTELLDVQQTEQENNEGGEAIEENVDAAVAVENLFGNMILAQRTKTASQCYVGMAQESLSYIAKSVKMPEQMVPALDYSTESFSTTGGATLAMEAAKSETKGFFTKIIDAILKGIAWAMDKVKELISKVFNNVDKMEKYANELKVQAGKMKGDGKGEKIKSAGFTLAFTKNGTVIAPIDAVADLKELTEGVSNRWVPEVLGKEAEFSVNNAATATQKAAAKTAINEFAANIDKIRNALPFQINNAKVMPKAEALKNLGISIDDSKEECYVSKTFARNKMLVTILPKTSAENPGTRISCRLVNVKDQSKEGRALEIAALQKASIINVIEGVLKVLGSLREIKQKIEKTSAIQSKLKMELMKLRASYLNVYKALKDEGGFKAYMSNVTKNVNLVKNLLHVLNEPGASVSTYVLFQSKSILDFCKESIKIANKENKDTEKEAEKDEAPKTEAAAAA